MWLRDRRLAAGISLVAVLGLGAAACGDDDGAGVRDGCETGGSASGSISGSASGGSSSDECEEDAQASGSGSGISATEVEGSTDNELVDQAVEDYREYVLDQVNELVTLTTVFTDAVRDGDVDAAKAAFAPSRAPWERIEPIASLISDIDGAVDARVDDFESEDDPAWTGWHKLEYLLWETGDLTDAGPIADQLDADIQTLATTVTDIELPPAALAVGAAELIEEVSEGKITGEEDRYSHTDLSDFDANVDGSAKLIELLSPALEEADADLLAGIEAGFAELDAGLATYRTGDTFKPYTELTEDDKASLTADLAALSEKLALVAGVLGLE